MEDLSGAAMHPADHEEPYATAGGCALKEAAPHGEPKLQQAPGRNCSPWREAHAGAGFLAGTLTLWAT